MKRRRTAVPRLVTASIAAYLLVLQAILGSFAYATPVDRTSSRDALGGVICIEHVDRGAPADHKENHRLPSCCLLGCSFVGHALLPARSGELLEIELEPQPYPIGRENNAGRRPRPEIHPHNPRAPPLLS
jgi:hypothetical protein